MQSPIDLRLQVLCDSWEGEYCRAVSSTPPTFRIASMREIGAFTTSGSVDPNSNIYIKRRADDELIEFCDHHNRLSFTQRLTLFFEEVLLDHVADPIVIFVDEIDTTLSLPFADDFFAAIRFLYMNRALNPALARVSFVLVGVATPT